MRTESGALAVQVTVMLPSPLSTIDPVPAALAGLAANTTAVETKSALATTMRIERVNRDISDLSRG
jgi:hypothetical protein